MTTLTLVVALLALAASVLALALATVANRRWVQRSSSEPVMAAGEDTASAEVDASASALSAGVAAGQADAEAARPAAAAAVVPDAVPGAVPGAVPDPVPDPTALRHVAVVRYDAYAEVGGRQSYSVAILDDTRSGLVLTTLAGKSDVRTYVRVISGGSSDGTLTPEEQQAIDAAAAGVGGSQS